MNWSAIIIAFIAALPPTILAAAAYQQARIARKSSESADREASSANKQAAATHQLVNSRMTQLLDLATKAATDAATLKEKQAQHVREGEQAVADAEKAKTDPSARNDSSV